MRHKIIETYIKELLAAEDFFSGNKNSFVEKMNKSFSQFETNSTLAYDRLTKLVNETPEFIIELTNRFLDTRESFSKFIQTSYNRYGNKNEPQIGYPEKMKRISELYETSSLFLLLGYLLSDGRLSISTKDPNSILKYFQSAGLSSKDRDEIRLIRNAVSHRFNVSDDCILFEKNQIRFSRIDGLYEKFDLLMSWNMTFFFFSLLFIPRFAILVMVSVYKHVVKYNLEWEKYFSGIKILFEDKLSKVRDEKEQKRTTSKGKSVTLSPVIKKDYSQVTDFIKDNIDFLLERITHHLSKMDVLFTDLYSKVNTAEEKAILHKIKFFFQNNGNSLIVFLKEYKQNPDEFERRLLKREQK